MRILYPICSCLILLSAGSLAGCRPYFYIQPDRSSANPPKNGVVNLRTGTIVERPDENPHPWKLPSGKTITVLSVSTVSYRNGVLARQLVYRTNTPVLNSPKLKPEVDEIWQAFQKQVAKLGLKAATITAKEAVGTGPNGARYGFTYGWEKGADNKWHAISPTTR